MCSLFLADEAQTLQFAAAVANCIEPKTVIYLCGDLGAGKTCFARGFIQALGHNGTVKSPTYTLVEEYELSQHKIYHFDLYRLDDPEELEFIGIRDYIRSEAILLIEWPKRGEGFIPEPDLIIDFEYHQQGRRVNVQSNSLIGVQFIEKTQSFQTLRPFLAPKSD